MSFIDSRRTEARSDDIDLIRGTWNGANQSRLFHGLLFHFDILVYLFYVLVEAAILVEFFGDLLL